MSAAFAQQEQQGQAAAGPEDRAVAFLAREVQRWRGKNGCFSCHNNGDAARALFVAGRAGLRSPPQALRQTKRWLLEPAGWEHNGGEGEFNDKQLARLQFTYALLTAVETGAVKDAGRAVQQAAALVAGHQQADGHWQPAAPGNVGSPVTYGPVLATVVTRRVLAAAEGDRYARHVEKADAWLLKQRPANVLDCSALLLGEHANSQRAAGQRRHCLDVLRRGQHEDGGWGPYIDAHSEPFDTAVALLALVRSGEHGAGPMIARGRAYLLREQLEDGSWQETTRPPGAESYAHRISTSGWATLALVKTRPASSE